MEKEDAQLVSESLLGNEGSFEKLVRRYTPQLYRFAYRLSGNVQAAEDATQETFIKVWKNLKKYDAKQPFRSWIFTIARNTVTDYLRKKKSLSFSVLSRDESSFEDTLSDTDPLPEEQLVAIETTGELMSLLATLPEEYRTVLTLHYQEGMTFEEIGKVMGRPPNTVKSWHRRALQKLHPKTA